MTEQQNARTLPALSAEDAEVFDRVWRRVMAGREPEPTLPVPAAQPAAPPMPVGQADGLAEHIRMRTALWRETQALGRKAAGSMARVLSGIAADERRQLARLAAAWYIRTGQRWHPEAGNAVSASELMEGLRQKYLDLQAAARMLEQAARMGEEPFEGLYADLASRDRENGKLILRLLEQMQM